MTIEILPNTEEANDEWSKRGWGHCKIWLTKEQVQALLDGKALGYDDGEYTTFFTLEEEK